MSKALGNLRVLDLSRVLAGPHATQIMGDLGAEIIKIEKPFAGDDTRFWGPPFLKDKDGKDTTESAYYMSVNRNKKSVAIDISHSEGQKLIHRLLESCDILIENFKVGGLEKYGLSYNQIKDRYPRLIYCSITGFGQTGPMASEPGYDLMAQAMAGLMSVTGDPKGPPMKVGVAVSDVITGLTATIGILAALNHRHETGRGQHVDVSLIDCTLASLVNLAQYYLTSGKTPARFGNAHSTIVPYEAVEAADGYIIIAVGNDGQFRRFCTMLEKPEWADDPRFANNSGRVLNRAVLVPMIENLIRQKPSSHWIEQMRDLDIPGGPVNTIDQVFAMDQVQHRQMEIEMPHTSSDKPVKLVGSPLKLSDTPVAYKNAPPVLGQDTHDVLTEILNLSAEEMAALKNLKAIQ
jgi:crotonobetainyl-CoA:carnitine CoA-transferase CaiB-like acyl-CoA transferase